MSKTLDVEYGSIQLQGVGRFQAKAAKEIEIGDTLVWNFGYTSKVLSIEFSKTGKTLTIAEKSDSSGNIHNRKMSAQRLVAYEKAIHN